MKDQKSATASPYQVPTVHVYGLTRSAATGACRDIRIRALAVKNSENFTFCSAQPSDILTFMS